jgi:small-conductance mechanosensitive channel
MTGNQLLSSGKLPTPKKQTDSRRSSGLKVYLFGQLGRGGFVHLFTTKTFILRTTKVCSYLFIIAWSVICGPLFFCYILVLVFLKRRFFVSYRNFLRQIDGIRNRETKRSNSLVGYFGYFVGFKGPPSQTT